MSEANPSDHIHQDVQQLALDTVSQEALTEMVESLESAVVIINVKRYLETVNNKPAFTRDLLLNARAQLQKAKECEIIEFVDVYGEKHCEATKEDVRSGKEPQLRYNSYLAFADEDPYRVLRSMPPQLQKSTLDGYGMTESVEELVKNSKIPIYIHMEEKCSCGRDSHDYNSAPFIQAVGALMSIWESSSEREELVSALQTMKDTARITNIVCIGHGSISRSPDSVAQHLVACTIAKELTASYEEIGRPLDEPIKIIAQDPAYTKNDIAFLSLFDPPIKVVNDPDGLLAIDEESMVMSRSPHLPIKQIIADLALSFRGRCPAAVFWNNSSWDERHGFDTVVVPWLNFVYPPNAGLQRTQEMLSVCTKVIDGNNMMASLASPVADCEGESGNDPGSAVGRSTVEDRCVGCAHVIEDGADTEGEEELPRPDNQTNCAGEPDGDSADNEAAGFTYGMGWLKIMQLWARMD